MDNLIFALNATLPIFFIMVLGYFLRVRGVITEQFASALNSFVFVISLPIKVFMDLAEVDFVSIWNPGYLFFCAGVTAVSIAIAYGASYLFRDKSLRGEFIIASFRSSSVLLGIAFVNNIYGNSGIAPLMVIASVPAYNVISVVILTLMKPENEGLSRELLGKTLVGILKNPIIIALFIGFVWSYLHIPVPVIAGKVLNSLSNTATPMGLIAMGAMFDPYKIKGKLGPVFTAVFLKLIGFCMLFVPLAALFGFRNEQMVAILVMLGSASTMAGYVMAKKMGHDGTVLASAVMLTTLLSAVTLTFWLWLTRTCGWI